jgi:type I restriction enzyme, R subunit
MPDLYESHLEEACLRWFADLGYEVLPSDAFEPESVGTERESLEDVILEGRLRAALNHLNPSVPVDAIEETLRRIRRHDAPTLEQNNLDFHRLLTDGLEVEVTGDKGGVRGVHVRLFDFDHPDRNDWLVSNQLRVIDKAAGGHERRTDIVVWVNGLPLAVVELKNPADPDADIWTAYNSLQTYKRDVPSLFQTNELLVVSDDVLSRVGSLTAEPARFQPWRAVRDEGDLRVPAEKDPKILDYGERLKALVQGVFEPSRFLDLIKSFVTFERAEGRIVKKIAGYHQFHAVRKAVDETVRATREAGDRRVGVVWHTQGSGKSLTMLFYAGKLIEHPAMGNPTLVVLTDRNDLDNQLFGVFSQAQALLRQEPQQARDREHLRELLQTTSGGVYFTTVQKFLPPDGKPAPPLSNRRNIVVIADEAHRSQYGHQGKVDRASGEIRYGFAKHLRDALPEASFVGFTGTPLELEDKNTVEVFGDYISIYDIRRAVEDGATVSVYYENRLANIELDQDEKPHIDPRFEEVTEGEEDTVKETLKSQWSTLEALVGADKRVALIAQDVVDHFERRTQVMEGKAMFVCMSRRICVAMYDAIVKLRPDWAAESDDEGALKIVYTGSAADKPEISKHVRSKARLELLAKRFKDPKDELKIVLVRDMWLTGFDAPCMHTMYIDKPMRGHNLMQAIARVNRVFGDKPGGLVVDYLGIAPFLKEALKTYSRSGGEGKPTEDVTEKALELMQEKLEGSRAVFDTFDYSPFFGDDPEKRLDLLAGAREHVLRQRTGARGEGKQKILDGYERFLKLVTELSKAAALVSSRPQYLEVRDEIAFFQAVKAGLVKLSPGRRQPMADLSHAIRQIVSNALVSDEVVDVFQAAGLDRPDISVLSEEFLAEVQDMRHKNLAAALLERLLRDQIKIRRRESIVQARSFEEMLENAVQRYLSRSTDVVQVVQELINLAVEMREATRRGEQLGLSREELAFYDALADNMSAREVLGDKTLRAMAQELVQIVRKNTGTDWNHKRSAQAKLRSAVRRLLKKKGYPPDGQEKATEGVLEQAKLLGINITDGASEADTEAPDSGRAAGGAPEAPLPYPIAVFDALVASQETAGLRVKTYIDGMERALALLTALAVAWLRERNGGALPESARAIFGKDLGKPVSMGTWHKYALRLAKLLPGDSDDPVVLAVRTLVDDDGTASDLARELADEVVPQRNTFSHGVTPSEAEAREHEAPMRARWERVTEALRPLRKVALVSLESIQGYAKPGRGIPYKVRRHMGDRDRFPLVDASIDGELQREWVYVLREGARPLSLSPFLFVRYSTTSGLHEMFLARAIELRPGKKVEALGIASTNKASVEIGSSAC